MRGGRIRDRLEHRWARPRLSAYIDGELARGQHARLERHAAGCPDCARTMRSLRLLLIALAGLGGAGGPPVAQAVISRLRGAGGGFAESSR